MAPALLPVVWLRMPGRTATFSLHTHLYVLTRHMERDWQDRTTHKNILEDKIPTIKTTDHIRFYFLTMVSLDDNILCAVILLQRWTKFNLAVLVTVV